MKIGIIGAGHMGATLGELWVAAGHEVFLAARSPETADAVAQAIGRGASVRPVSEVARDADAVDATNLYPQRDGPISEEVLAARARLESGPGVAHRGARMTLARVAPGPSRGR